MIGVTLPSVRDDVNLGATIPIIETDLKECVIFTRRKKCLLHDKKPIFSCDYCLHFYCSIECHNEDHMLPCLSVVYHAPYLRFELAKRNIIAFLSSIVVRYKNIPCWFEITIVPGENEEDLGFLEKPTLGKLRYHVYHCSNLVETKTNSILFAFVYSGPYMVIVAIFSNGEVEFGRPKYIGVKSNIIFAYQRLKDSTNAQNTASSSSTNKVQV